MIPEAAVKRLARLQRVDPVVVDRDHALGVVLWALAPELKTAGWVFKGGTCLRKCYYGDYRFSEDLDFTAVGSLRRGEAEALVARAASRAAGEGIRLLLDELHTEVMDDEYGRESFEIKVPYQGALRMGSSPSVQLHLSAHEEMVFPVDERRLIHPYDDRSVLRAVLPCYSLEEVLTEKLRAVAGQRKFAVARDVYDIAQLMVRGDVEQDAAVAVLPRKAEVKGVDLSEARQRFLEREAEYRVSWNRTLVHLTTVDADFTEAFETTAGLLARIST